MRQTRSVAIYNNSKKINTKIFILVDRHLHIRRNAHGAHPQRNPARLQLDIPASPIRNGRRQARIHRLRANVVPLRAKPPRRRRARVIPASRRGSRDERDLGEDASRARYVANPPSHPITPETTLPKNTPYLTLYAKKKQKPSYPASSASTTISPNSPNPSTSTAPNSNK